MRSKPASQQADELLEEQKAKVYEQAPCSRFWGASGEMSGVQGLGMPDGCRDLAVGFAYDNCLGDSFRDPGLGYRVSGLKGLYEVEGGGP